ncbi:LOW QUALITY PROTEIN: IQ domain-containing protein N [Ochotona curzoniae]|uniref:LOW QUALITY PROTEIN: IQ domain-containing protein N n=1 Tax=Ochotona curzoniae TaxID=130825 RepID=UPI001B352B43|nr:LOW QUALITY PROTEIN: IQ domain-containing protein N [Ochotona curzoniae]
MNFQDRTDLPQHQNNATSNTASVHQPAITQWAVLPVAPVHPSLQDKEGRPTPQPQHEPHQSKEHLPPPPAQDKTAASPPHRIPRLRKVVESQAFKNILVDEMDMMLSRAATLIQANWRGYQLRQKLISQMMAAKAIQEAWRRFNTKRILRSSKAVVKKAAAEEADIPYHPPQQVRFQHLEGSQARPKQPIMVSKETQFPSSDSLATCAPQMSHICTTPSQRAPEPAPCAPGVAGVAFLPHQTVAIRFPCPMSFSSKYQPCLLTETVQSACLVRHMEGDTLRARHVTARDGKPAPCPRYGQTAATQAHMDTEIFKVTPAPCPCPTSMATRPPPKIYPTCVATTKALGKNYAVPTMTVVKPLPQPCPAPTLTKTQVRPIASQTSNPPPTRPAGLMAKIPPQVCLLASMLKSPPQARPPAASKVPPHAYPVPVVPKSSPHIRLATAPAKSPLQPPCHVTAVPKTPSQTCPSGSSMAKPPPQTRLAAMINKTPAQIRSVAAVLKTLCMTPPAVAASNLKTTPQAGTAAGFPGTASHIHLSLPKTKVTVNVKQTAGAIKLSSHSCLAEGKNKAPGRPPHPEAAAPKTVPPASEKVKVCPTQRHMKTETVVSKTNVAVTRPTSWTKVAEARSKPPPVYVPAEVAMTLPQPQLAIPLTKEALSQTHLTSQQSKAGSQVHMAASLTKAPSQAQLTTCLSKTVSQTRQPPEPAGVLPEAQLASCPPATQPQAPLATCPSKAAPPRVHPLAEQTKILSQGRLATCLVRSSPPIYTSSKLAKDLSQGHLTSCTCPTKISSQVHASTQQVQAVSQAPLTTKPSTQTHPPPELTVVLPQTHLMASCAPTPISHTQLSPGAAKTPSQIHPPTKLVAKTASLAHLITCLSRAQSQAHLPLNLTKAQSHAQLATEASKGVFAAHQSTDLSAKTQSQPILAQSKASTPPCHHLGTLPRATPDDRLTILQGKATQGPPPPQRQAAADAPGMLVPLLAPSGHMPCNMESWGDSATARTPLPTASSQVVPCQDDLATSQIASLCAELASVLGSQEDLRALLTKALAQGEVRAALNQALSKEVLGATVAKALPQGMLSMALMKALSWGELGIALSRALARGELRNEHTKAVQGRLAEVLSKALTEEERAALSQALCQGELGAVLSQSVSQAALRLPKGVSKTAAAAAAVEADFRGTPTASWAPTLGLMRPQPSKGPVDAAGVAAGQSWNAAVPSVAVRPMASRLPAATTNSGSDSSATRGAWDAVGGEVATDPRQLGDLVVSVQTMERLITHAVITIQACARGYLVRRTVRLWHQWATIIQATWRGYCVRRNLARLYQATTTIQAAWRGYCTRRQRAHQVLLPAVWAQMSARAMDHSKSITDSSGGGGLRSASEHRCFQSCRPHACNFCQSLSNPGLGNPPSVVMLVGSSPRTCHTCGHTLPTRVVHGMGRSVSSNQGTATQWTYSGQLGPQSPRQICGRARAATAIQSAWRGFRIRRQLREQQTAARMLQATWRGHYTRNSLTTDALLDSGGPWDHCRNPNRSVSRTTQWPGV